MKKKILLIGISFLPLLTACGCSKETNQLKCSFENAQGAVVFNYILSYDDEWKTIEKFEIEEVVDFSKVNDIATLGCGESVEDCLKEAKNDYTMCKSDSKYENCELKDETESGLTILTKVKDLELKKEENVFSIYKNTVKDEAIKKLEELGYKCQKK